MMGTPDEADRAAEAQGARKKVRARSVTAHAKIRRTAPAQGGRNADLLGLLLTAQFALLTFVALLAPRRG